ncbi:MAG TPA: prolipoprotein diacylglyceryl transferase [Clostridia bacterium]|jgi:phosphatidylglycerol:prolipoprotein diacylglycerol transferase|nr:prolipoprotein diacylglyceryl transferase [Clostridia bacterium]HQM96757.1 prolipoprotein diacylglyceryl transferase [Clostridia bacterium]
MKPFLIIFGQTVSSYRLFAVLAVIFGITSLLLILHKKKIGAWKTISLVISMLLFFFIGARLFNFLINPAGYENISVFKLEFVGLSVYGGFTGASLALILWSILFHIPIWEMFDLCIIPASGSFAIARIGCFLNGCCSGKFSNSIFAVVYPKFIDSNWLDSYPVLPTQLFEMTFAIILLIPALIIYKKNSRFPQGSAFLIYASLFCVMRLVILQYRRLPYEPWIKLYFYPAFYITLIFVFILIFLYRYIKNSKYKDASKIT